MILLFVTLCSNYGLCFLSNSPVSICFLFIVSLSSFSCILSLSIMYFSPFESDLSALAMLLIDACYTIINNVYNNDSKKKRPRNTLRRFLRVCLGREKVLSYFVQGRLLAFCCWLRSVLSRNCEVKGMSVEYYREQKQPNLLQRKIKYASARCDEHKCFTLVKNIFKSTSGI